MAGFYFDRIDYALAHDELPDLLIGQDRYFMMARNELLLTHDFDMMLDFLTDYNASYPEAGLKRRVTEAVREGLDSDNPGVFLNFCRLLIDSRWRREHGREPMVFDLDDYAARAARRMEAQRDDVVEVIQRLINPISANRIYQYTLECLTTRIERIH